MTSVLIVDDSPVLREVIKNVLTWSGYTVCGEGGNTKECLELLRTTSPDILLLDLMMPGDSGVDIAPEIKSLYPKLKIILLCSVAKNSLGIVDLFQDCFDGVLYKPFNSEELLLEINRCLSTPAKAEM